MSESKSERVERLDRETATAYSYDRYNSWKALIKMLIGRGYSDKEIKAMLLSKWTRWAADGSSNPYGRASARDFAKMLDSERNLPQKIAELVAGFRIL